MQKLKNFIKTLEGKKTYILSTVTVFLNVLVAIDPNLLNQNTLLKIDGVLIALGGAALRASIGRV